MEFCVSTYLSNHHGKDFTPALVPLCGPFVYVYQHESLACLAAYTKLLDMMDEWLSLHSLDQQISNFMILLRIMHPDLLLHFEEEEVDVRRLVTSWFETLLAKQLPIESVLRLWEVYFTHGLSLHVYICLATVQFYKDELEELEQSEIESFFYKIPQSFRVEPTIILAKEISLHIESSNSGSI